LGRTKLERFAENLTFDNFFQPTYDQIKDGYYLKGKWASDFFKNNNPLILELGCGKGEYTVGLAKKYPDKNFIGVDIKGARMWKGCKTSVEEKMTNVAFLRTRIELIEHFFGKNEVSEIWITFPDPQPRRIKENKRLTSPVFLKRYSNILDHNGIIHLKTDAFLLYYYTLEIIKEYNHRILFNTSDLYSTEEIIDAKNISTYYENIFLAQNKKINYIKFMLSKNNE
jgi:tRNA (guanine-N7-)-methyltransferase